MEMGFSNQLRLRALGHPLRVVPFVGVEVDDDGAGRRAQFGAEGVGIGFEGQQVAVGADDFKFVDGAFAEFRHEEFPDAGAAAGAHRMDAAVPMVEVADHADALRVGSPDGEVDAADARERDDVRTELVVGVVVAAFAHEV